ncbi:Uu.00g037330.m01.CDS01 [Anthostomella pinea]|uniref:DNA helicase n=1 Tax=Anthostomella pinea TaxID=933095 RepID=A0AAI8YDM1_9PEZI|nr:Uu.00g037330.m01.CDS01 [Anthostomella pinea]
MTATASPKSAPTLDNAQDPPATTSDSPSYTNTIPETAGVPDVPPSNSQTSGNHDVDQSAAAQVAADDSIDNNDDGDVDGRPAKRRRVRDTTPDKQSRRPKPISPPWKKIEAEGPTSFTDNGKRRSGRTNAVPLELQAPGTKRLTRGAIHGLGGSPASKEKRASTNGHSNGTPKNASTAKRAASKAPAPVSKPLNGSRQSPRTRRRSPSPPPASTSPQRSTRTSRSLRAPRDSLDNPVVDSEQPTHESPNSRPTRIRLRIKPVTLPIVHPAQVNVPPGQTIARPKVGSSFNDFVGRAPTIDVNDGGWLDLADEGPPYTQESAEKDASIILRIEAEAEPGGLLSEARSALFVPEPVEEPPRQWAHADHLLKQMANFRKLMLMEQQRHKATAKRLAEACRDEWIRRQPKSAEQIEAEARVAWIARYRTVVRAVAGTWENVKVEINRRRLEEWEAAEQKRVKAALNEAVNMSELKLQARRAHFDSEALSDDEDDEDLDESDEEAEDDDIDMDSDEASVLGDGLGNDEDNMSSSDDDDEDAKSNASDEGLTQEQLLQKYTNVPELPDPEEVANDVGDNTGTIQPQAEDEGETTDESVDMDDDLGTSDEDMDSNGDDGGEPAAESEGSGEDDEEDEEPSGLLGLFFGKNELKRMEQDTTNEETVQSPQDDVDMVDAPEPAAGKLDADHQAAETGRLKPGAPLGGPSPRENLAGAVETPAEDRTDAGNASSTQVKVATSRGPSSGAVEPPSDPQLSNQPDAPTSIPKPLQAHDIEMEIIGTVERANEGSAEKAAAIPSVEVIDTSSEQQQLSSDTDAVTNPLSRDRSQSPRTADTKPSEVDTSSSVVKSGASRSISPHSPHSQVPKTEAPFLLRGTLREYQHYGLDWLAGLYRNQTNGILADEMGLGKTIQTIALLAHLACHHEVWGPHLVIVPTSVMLNWEMEFKKWCPGFKVLSYYGSIEERRRKRQGWKTDDMWNVCITSYQIVLADQQVFKRRQWHYMVLDEAHNIKNFKSKRWQTLLGFNTQARLLLTGTPLQNNLTELWSLLFFLMPSENGVGGFADLAEFQDWFHKPESQILESGREQMDDEARAIIAKLHKVLRPYLLRRLKADVEKQMPGKYEHVEFCRLSRRQRELYDGFLGRTDTREALSSGNYISVINCLMQLRKVCNHPDLFVERPIMTSFRQPRSIVADYETTENHLRGKLLAVPPMSIVNLSFLNLVPAQHEELSNTVCERTSELSSHGALMDLREAQKARAQAAYTNLDPSTVESNIIYLESAARWGRFEELQHHVYLNALRRQQRPVYGKRLTDLLTLGVNERPFKARPRVPQKIMSWFEEESPVLRSMVPTLDQRASLVRSTISKFACVTPAVVTRDIDRFVLGSGGVEAFDEMNLKLAAPIRYAPFMPKEPPLDPWHESRMRLSIQFPDKRLLQYDCGKLQALDRLLRKLQSGGHRALIFTQMTKVLDILELFLNIHGHKYLRLDGATKIEQRQIMTDRFNNDPRILCFILSTRSGGLGINLTGADTVIFYDQDWNPAMDKQCQDRCHRIGQTRDVHIYRLVSEHTIEANILRKASQKQMLDDIVIQEGGFTTDYFNKLSVRDVIGAPTDEADVVGDAMDRVLGGVENSDHRAVGRVLEQAEDREDVDAAHVAEKEIQEDEADFEEKPATATGSGTSSARQGSPATRDDSAAPGVGRSNLGLYAESADTDGVLQEMESNAWGERIQTIDDYMLGAMGKELEGTPLELPKDKKKSKSKKGKDTRKRQSHATLGKLRSQLLRMTSPAKQDSQHGDFRQYLPDLSSSRFTTMAQNDAYGHARELKEKQAPPWLYGLYMHWRKLFQEPFKGITNDGTVKPGLFTIQDEGIPIDSIVAAASAVVSQLSPEQASKTLLHIDSPEWRTWSNPEFLISDKGIRLDELTPSLRDSVLEVLQATLSPEGYAKARDAMRINHFLGELVGAPRVMNEHSYNFVLFGAPSTTAPWGFSFYGHHLCLSVFLYRTHIVVSPWFTGAEPNVVDAGPYEGTRILQEEERLGLRLMQSLGDGEKAAARVYKLMKDPDMPRGRWNHDDQRHLCGAYRDNRVVPYEGVVVGTLSTTQQDLVRCILSQYLLYLPARAREIQLRNIAARFDETYFSWIGGFGDADAFYYRIQSPVVVVEFDHHSGVFLTNGEPAKFHVHTLLRTPNAGDYGFALRGQIEGVEQAFVWEG